MDRPATLLLKPGREKSLTRRHPWVFSGAISAVRGSPALGESVDILDASGSFLARAAYSPHSQIRARVWTWDEEQRIDEDFFRRRLQQAFAARQAFLDPSPQAAIRLVHAESDRLPGLIIDRYAGVLVFQFLSAGPEAWRDLLVDLSHQLTGTEHLYERSDVDARSLEGLPERVGPLRNTDQVGMIQIEENGLYFQVDIAAGHKTGFYLDQRQNRARLREMSAGREVLDCFSYTGGFSVNALAGGAASVLALDASGAALAQLRRNLTLNRLPEERVDTMEGDVFQLLRTFRDRGRTFDLIVLDPPKFAQAASQVQRAARGYKDINLLAFKLLKPGGLLVTFSCSGAIGEDLFQKIVAGAALDAGMHAQIIQRLSQSPDHPVALNFPEGAYLKGLVLRVGS
jgi:23S rRNA (cytosine1962-C5)-methyltransferase